MIFTAEYASPLGTLLLAERGGNIIGCWFTGQKYFPVFREETCRTLTPVLAQAQDWLREYFAGNNPDIASLPLAPEGSAFRQAVWQQLMQIPYGKTVTYGEIAAVLARETGKQTMSAQAVGGAVGHNPISVMIPCHRVVGRSGLTGYAGGLDRKQALLSLEASCAKK